MDNAGKMLGDSILDAVRQAVREEIRAVMGSDKFSTTPHSGAAPERIKPYLTVGEAAELARIAPSTIRLYIRKGQLKRQRVGRRVIVARAELERFLGTQSGNVVDLYPP